MLSGEGATDIGDKDTPGPMAYIVDRLIEKRIDYSLLENETLGADCVMFVGESDLTRQGKVGPMLFPGLKQGKGQKFFARSAQILGQLAKSEQERTRAPVIAVFFRDADGTRTRDEWSEKCESMVLGFKLAEFGTGVPMVPRPKSEAWLLCALLEPPYEQCEKLEDVSGNDASPNSPKKQLEALLGEYPPAEKQIEFIRSGRIDPTRIEMPSFSRFRDSLQAALDIALSRKTQIPASDCCF